MKLQGLAKLASNQHLSKGAGLALLPSLEFLHVTQCDIWHPQWKPKLQDDLWS